MKQRRLLEILYYLSLNPYKSASQLAAHFEVSKRTILRDMDDLLVAGFPLSVTYGRNGGYTLDMKHSDIANILTSDDQKTLSSLLATLKLFPSSSLRKLATDTPWFEYDFSGWTHNDTLLFDTIRHHIQSKEPYSFQYMNAQGQTHLRSVIANKLIYKERFWYLNAYDIDKEDTRFFKLRRMMRSIDIDTIPQSWITLEVEIIASSIFKIYDECLVIKVSDIGEFKRVIFACPESQWVLDFLLSFGPNLKVIAPLHYKEHVHKALKKALNQYD